MILKKGKSAKLRKLYVSHKRSGQSPYLRCISTPIPLYSRYKIARIKAMLREWEKESQMLSTINRFSNSKWRRITGRSATAWLRWTLTWVIRQQIRVRTRKQIPSLWSSCTQWRIHRSIRGQTSAALSGVISTLWPSYRTVRTPYSIQFTIGSRAWRPRWWRNHKRSIVETLSRAIRSLIGRSQLEISRRRVRLRMDRPYPLTHGLEASSKVQT